MITIYLAGAIDGLTYQEATSWRNKATIFLRGCGCQVLDPMRPKDELVHLPTIRGGEGYTSEEIVHRDLWDVRRADIILAEMTDLSRPYRGTISELTAARLEGKIVILWTDPEFVKSNPWAHWWATRAFAELDDCLRYIGDYLL